MKEMIVIAAMTSQRMFLVPEDMVPYIKATCPVKAHTRISSHMCFNGAEFLYFYPYSQALLRILFFYLLP